MNILCFIDSLGSGGAQRQMVELAKGFKENNHYVVFLVYHNEPFFLPDLDKCKIPCFCIEEDNFVIRTLKIRTFIRKGNFDVVISFLEAANFMATLSGFPYRKWKLLVGERSAKPMLLKSSKLIFFRLFHSFADYVIFNSFANLDLVKRVNPFLRDSKLKVIYNIVDKNKFSLNKLSPMNKNPNFLNLVVVSSHQYIKNCFGLIEALSLLSYECQLKIKVNWYGDEKNDDSLKFSKNLSIERGVSHLITFYPAVNNIEEVMSSSDFVGLFSFYEGLPNVICEAMTLGKPVISSDVSDLSQIIENSTLLFDPYSIEEIHMVLNLILSLSKEEIDIIGAKNRKKALKLFDKNKIIDSYLSLLK